ncbi:Ig-like domain repeat protein [Nocardioides hwasunensis]|uniref:Ig-like domain repeat protein n=1 Tax=Nocardioides hwasunensis TaxID=397258 RepID=A0ABR8MC39_9ACTN|nr:Ig-like domain repeat protein [Nocardioides hwasunensis]MBD3913508.1 Ig-like domain repeat protein [Nocardioides hwasunensis]
MRRGARTALALGTSVVLAGTLTSVAGPASAATQPLTVVSGWGGFDVGQSVVPAGLAGREVWSVSAGDEHSLAITSDGAVTGWGWNGDGQIDIPSDLATGATMASSVDAGVYASLAIAWDGSVRGWGALGDTDEGQIDIPAELRGPHPASRASTVSMGTYHALAIVGGGRVVAWGAEGRHAAINAGQTHVPQDLLEGSHYAVDVAAGYLHSVAVDTRGVVSVWGSNRHGEKQVPARVAEEDVIDVEAHGATSMVLTADGEVIAWGDSGTGLTELPAALDGVKVVDIDLGAEVAMALTSTGDVITWGNAGKIHPVPAAVSQYAPITGIAAGGRHLLAMHRAPAPPPVATPPVTSPAPAPPAPVKATTSLTLKAPARVVAGRKVAVRVTLTGTTAGPVVITDKGRKVATRAGSGTVRLRLARGRHTLVATYAGSASALASTSGPLTVKVVAKKKRQKR